MLTLARSVQDPALLLEAHQHLGHLRSSSESLSAREHLEQGIALYDPQQHRSLPSSMADMTPGCPAWTVSAWPLWYLGYPEQALKRSHEALTLARS